MGKFACKHFVYRLSVEAYHELDAQVDNSCDQLKTAAASLEALLEQIHEFMQTCAARRPQHDDKQQRLPLCPFPMSSNSPRRRNSLSPKVIGMLSHSAAAASLPVQTKTTGHTRGNHDQLDINKEVTRAALTSIFQSCLDDASIQLAECFRRVLIAAGSYFSDERQSLESTQVWFKALKDTAIKTLRQHGQEQQVSAFALRSPIERMAPLEGTTAVDRIIVQLREKQASSKTRQAVAMSIVSQEFYVGVMFDFKTLTSASLSTANTIANQVEKQFSNYCKAGKSEFINLQHTGSNTVQALAAATKAVRLARTANLETLQRQSEATIAMQAKTIEELQLGCEARHDEEAAAAIREMTTKIEKLERKLSVAEAKADEFQTQLAEAIEAKSALSASHAQHIRQTEMEQQCRTDKITREQASLVSELNKQRAAFRQASARNDAQQAALAAKQKEIKDTLENVRFEKAELESQLSEAGQRLQRLTTQIRLREAGEALLEADSSLTAQTAFGDEARALAPNSPIAGVLLSKLQDTSCGLTGTAGASHQTAPQPPTANLARSIVAELARIRAIKAQERVDLTAFGLKAFVERAQLHVMEAAKTEQNVDKMRSEMLELQYQLESKRTEVTLSTSMLGDLQQRLLSQHQQLNVFQTDLLQRAAAMAVFAQTLDTREAVVDRKEEALRSLTDHLEAEANKVSRELAQAQYLGKLKLNLRSAGEKYAIPPNIQTPCSPAEAVGDVPSKFTVSPVSTRSSSPASNGESPSETQLHAPLPPANIESLKARRRWSSSVNQLRKVTGAVQFVTRVQTLVKSPTRAAPSPPPVAAHTATPSPEAGAATELQPTSISSGKPSANRRWSRLRRAFTSHTLPRPSTQQPPAHLHESTASRSKSMREIAVHFKQ